MKTSLVFLVSLLEVWQFTFGTVLLESSCDAEVSLDWSSATQSYLTVESAAVIEDQVAAYFLELLQQVDTSDDIDGIEQVTVSVMTGQTIQNGTKVLLSTQSRVNVIYRTGKGFPIDIDTVLAGLVETDNLSELKFNGLPVASLTFQAIVDDSKVIFYDNDSNGRSTADAGLIAATVIMSFILLLVSSVLLYITGGWDAFKQSVTNCLFEEIDDDDDHYLARSKPDFHVSQTEDDEDRDIEADEPSVVTGMQTNPSGMLGVRVPTDGLGIGNGYLTDGDEATNFTEMSAPQRLGINSASKMNDGGRGDESSTGLAQMIMRRIGNTPN
ncbi:hypothetical protein FisN_28Hh036 [Fistulifera solaris]|uniref:SEA domain-containing protein n=1 Tax=Fistulifera solaris TaxID=1519565 RepID=A0A1Z5KH74_FISSO|nr:hypothetical protein FisN_28Hh036 [Fistulifera solaris]|eukprot:GAX25567.1 hypothetical protein FisN_28Hh036 [Fistulifera solaris]